MKWSRHSPTGHEPIDTGGLVPPTEEAEGDPAARGWGEEPGPEGIGPIFPPGWDFGESFAPPPLPLPLPPGQAADLARALGHAGALNRALVRELREQLMDLLELQALILGKLLRVEAGLCSEQNTWNKFSLRELLDSLEKEKQGIEAQIAALDKEFDAIKKEWKERGFKEVSVRHWASGVIVEQWFGGDAVFDPESLPKYELHGRKTDYEGWEAFLDAVGPGLAAKLLSRAVRLRRIAQAADDIVPCETAAEAARAAKARPGSVSGNPGNRLVETGIPKKDGSGWVKRWTRMTAEDEIKQAEAIAQRYEEVLEEANKLTAEQRRAYKFEQMRQFRTEYRDNFLKTREY